MDRRRVLGHGDPVGRRHVADHRGSHGPGTGWVVLADPEGNEFCILRSAEEVVGTD
ncbi:MAG: VOC family protein [Actinomycetales bacterium]